MLADSAGMSWPIVVASAAIAGAVNAIAGGGTFLTFPALTGVAGLTEKVANMTSTVGLWPGSAASVVAAAPDMKKMPRGMLIAYTIISLVGGILGALLLIKTSDRDFRLLIPWLLAFATVIFAFSKPIARWAGRKHGHRTPAWTVIVGVLQLAVAVYGGYFGAGIGVLMIACLSFSGLDDIHQMNALKVTLATVINGAAAILFVTFRFAGTESIEWRYAAVMAVASVIGGFVGMRIARRVPQAALRGTILTIGVTLTAIYFWKAYSV